MWANAEMVEFSRWLARHNSEQEPDRRVACYGLDVYSLWDSLHETIDYLREHEPEHVEPALEAVRCFEPYADDPQAYARSTRWVPEGCEDPVIRLLSRLRQQAARVNAGDREARFNAEQNALVAAGAEAFYRSMVRGGPESWNVRDTHMADTLDRLLAHHGGVGTAKAVVWEHNTHVGDARATSMAQRGLINVGQLARERHGEDQVVLVGFGSWQGTVIAAYGWGDPMQVLPVPPARAGSLEDLLHAHLPEGLGGDALLVFPTDQPEWLREKLDHRAIGVVYHPEAERYGNYVSTVLGRRYDAFCWFDETSALRPLHGAGREAEDETWPFGE
jgi:erythromycin esterase-like protein